MVSGCRFAVSGLQLGVGRLAGRMRVASDTAPLNRLVEIRGSDPGYVASGRKPPDSPHR
jgi:hypothetical protein